MADRNPARVAAPLALLAALVAVVVVVQATGSSSSSSPPPARTTATQSVRHVRAAPKAYVVKAGDTLTVIADKTGVSLDTIQRLNPDVDPNALQTGQRLTLSP
jgi:LysM repeat protein